MFSLAVTHHIYHYYIAVGLADKLSNCYGRYCQDCSNEWRIITLDPPNESFGRVIIHSRSHGNICVELVEYLLCFIDCTQKSRLSEVRPGLLGGVSDIFFREMNHIFDFLYIVSSMSSIEETLLLLTNHQSILIQKSISHQKHVAFHGGP